MVVRSQDGINSYSQLWNGRRLKLRGSREKKKASKSKDLLAFIGSQGGIRTPDQAVNSRLLYH